MAPPPSEKKKENTAKNYNKSLETTLYKACTHTTKTNPHTDTLKV
jgi:hypothetical protein